MERPGADRIFQYMTYKAILVLVAHIGAYVPLSDCETLHRTAFHLSRIIRDSHRNICAALSLTHADTLSRIHLKLKDATVASLHLDRSDPLYTQIFEIVKTLVDQGWYVGVLMTHTQSDAALIHRLKLNVNVALHTVSDV